MQCIADCGTIALPCYAASDDSVVYPWGRVLVWSGACELTACYYCDTLHDSQHTALFPDAALGLPQFCRGPHCATCSFISMWHVGFTLVHATLTHLKALLLNEDMPE